MHVPAGITASHLARVAIVSIRQVLARVVAGVSNKALLPTRPSLRSGPRK